MTDLLKYDLILFDLDGTLADRDTGKLLPGAKDWFEQHRENFHLAIVSNQGGVGLRYWMEDGGFGEPEKYPTEYDVLARIDRVLGNLDVTAQDVAVYICYAYQSRKGLWSPVPVGCEDDDEWSEKFRKPAPGMLKKAMHQAAGRYIAPEKTLMVGDRPEDQQAAQNAGCDFQWAGAFFGRGKPE